VVSPKPDSQERTPEAELQSYLDRLDPNVQQLSRAVRAAVRERLPTANELAYDYKTFVVIAYSPTERGIDGVVSIAARPDGVRLYLMRGPQLPDQNRLLQGTGKQARFIRVETVNQLASPDVEALIGAAIELAEVPLPCNRQGTLIIRSSGAKQRSRRESTKSPRAQV